MDILPLAAAFSTLNGGRNSATGWGGLFVGLRRKRVACGLIYRFRLHQKVIIPD